MTNSKNDERDRSGKRSTPPQDSTSPKTPQARDTTNRDRDFEEGRNITNQGWTGDKSPKRDSEKDDERGLGDIEE